MPVSALPEAETRAARALDLIMRVRDVNDGELAEAMGVSRESVRARRRSITKLTRADGDVYAAELRVPSWLFAAREAEILRWFADEWAARDSNPEPADTTRGETFVTARALRCAA